MNMFLLVFDILKTKKIKMKNHDFFKSINKSIPNQTKLISRILYLFYFFNLE